MEEGVDVCLGVVTSSSIEYKGRSSSPSLIIPNVIVFEFFSLDFPTRYTPCNDDDPTLPRLASDDSRTSTSTGSFSPPFSPVPRVQLGPNPVPPPPPTPTDAVCAISTPPVPCSAAHARRSFWRPQRASA